MQGAITALTHQRLDTFMLVQVFDAAIRFDPMTSVHHAAGIGRQHKGQGLPLIFDGRHQPGSGFRHQQTGAEIYSRGPMRKIFRDDEGWLADLRFLPTGAAVAQMDMPQFFVDLVVAQRHRQVQTLQALRTIEQLVHGHPEIQSGVEVHLKIHRPEALGIALELHGNVGAVAHWHHPDAVRIIVDEGQETAQRCVIARGGGADAGDSGTREAQVGMPAMHGVGGAAIFTGKRDHRQRRAPGFVAQAVERGRTDAVDIVEHGLDLGGSGEQL
ncbi:hypothetical protein D3C87_842700 [compost metagenome]